MKKLISPLKRRRTINLRRANTTKTLTSFSKDPALEP